VIQVLRTNRRIYEDKEEDDEAKVGEEENKGDNDDHEDEAEEETTRAKSEDEEVVIPTEEIAKRRGKRKSAKQDKKKKLVEVPAAEDNADPGADEDATEGDRKRMGDDGAMKGKKKKGGRKRKGGRSADEGEELVDWGWDFVTGDDDGQVTLWSGQEFGAKKTVKAHDFIWWLEVHSDTCITASTDRTAKGSLLRLLLAIDSR
jgi:hypothetical protein